MIQFRLYDPQNDYTLCNDWWKARRDRGDTDFPANVLPPLGVLVEDEGNPVCALWCYECYGVGVAFMEWPVSTPGLSPKQAREYFRHAITALTHLAGKTLEPPGQYQCFRVSAPRSLVPSLTAMGFAFESETDRIPLMLTLP